MSAIPEAVGTEPRVLALRNEAAIYVGEIQVGARGDIGVVVTG